MIKAKLGEFEQVVLLACLRLRSAAYTVAIIDEIRAHTGRRPTHGHVYVALRRLEQKGFVRSTLASATHERGGRGKRFFTVTSAGVNHLRDVRRTLEGMWHGLDEVATGASE